MFGEVAMGRTVCRTCDNAGVIYVKKQKRNPDGSVESVEVKQTCPTCRGQGWVETGGG